MQELLGQVVKNDGVALKQALAGLEPLNFRHLGDFVFKAELPEGKIIIVSTIPVDEPAEEIRIVGISLYVKASPIS